MITEPGVYQLSDAEYHGDPVPGGSLSASGAKVLLRAPALYRWERQHGRPPKREFDVGHAAHKLVLGVGPELHVTDVEEWRTKAVKEEVAEARAAGKVPIKPSEFDAVTGMVHALRAHPVARHLLDPEQGGRPEQSLFWQGEDVWLRSRLDWLPDPDRPGRVVIPDYKTTTSSHPGAIRKQVADYGYHVQDAWYRAAVDNLISPNPAFVFIFQEKTPPYLVTVVQLDEDAQQVGHRAMSRAIEMYRDCTESGIWPGYVGDYEIPEINLPPWIENEEYA